MIDNQVILQFCKIFSEKYKIEKEEVEDVWKEFCGIKKDIKKNVIKDKEIKKDKTNIKDKKQQVETNIKDKEILKNENYFGCPYKLVKGKKAGQICGTKSKHGLYCSTHKKYENVEQKQRNVVPVCARTQLAKKEDKPKVENKTTFRKNKELNLYVNTTNNFALSSVKDKIVVGKIIDNELVKLNDEDKEECERLCLKYN